MKTFVLTTILLASVSAAALADPPMEEIVVTADYRQSDLNKLAASASVVDASQITERDAHHLEEILNLAANVNFASGGSRARFFQIRGIGERGQFAETLIPSVGLIIDDIDFSGSGTVATLFDVEQVEIMRGPQGTRYGANALAGLINVKTRDPTGVPEYLLQLEGGDYATYGLGAVASGPLGSDEVLYRVAYQRFRSDGFGYNDYLHKPTNKRDESTLRTKLRWLATDTLTIDLNASVLDVDNGYDAFSLDNVRDTLSDQPGQDRQRSKLAGIHVDWSAPERFDVQAIFGVGNGDSRYGYDEDWVYDGFDPNGYTSTDYYNRSRKTRSGEVRLISDEDRPVFGNTTDWLVGIYALNQDEKLVRQYTWLASNFVSDYEIDRRALYGQTDTALGPLWTLTVGLRLERFDARYRDSDAIRFTPDESLHGGRVVLSRALGDGRLAYFDVSRGYKSGGFNADGRLDPSQRSFDSEGLWNYELGIKGRWLDRRLTARAALFYMDRRDVQISSSIIVPLPGGASEFVELVDNAAEGDNLGLELEGSFAATDRLTLAGSIGLLRTEYKHYVNTADPAAQKRLNGRDQAHAPPYQFSTSATYAFAERLTAEVTLEGKDDFYFSDSHDFKSEPYALVHANVAWRGDGWSLSLWGRNLFDKDYYVRGYYFGNDPRIGYEPRGYTQLGEPRNFGITFTMER